MVKKEFFRKITETYRDFLKDNLISIILFGSHARGDAKIKSDYDIFIIAEDLPSRPFPRLLFIRTPLKGQFDERLCIIAKTREEILSSFPPLFLDLGLDGIILYDKDNFFKQIQVRIKEIIQQAGLQRKKMNGDFYWTWENPPQKGWEINWSGYREF